MWKENKPSSFQAIYPKMNCLFVYCPSYPCLWDAFKKHPLLYLELYSQNIISPDIVASFPAMLSRLKRSPFSICGWHGTSTCDYFCSVCGGTVRSIDADMIHYSKLYVKHTWKIGIPLWFHPPRGPHHVGIKGGKMCERNMLVTHG